MIARLRRWWLQRQRPLGERVTVHVTNDDIANGHPGHAGKCPFALAIGRLFPGCIVSVGRLGVNITDNDGRWAEFWSEPSARLKQWTIQYDHGQYVKPITVTLTRSFIDIT